MYVYRDWGERERERKRKRKRKRKEATQGPVDLIAEVILVHKGAFVQLFVPLFDPHVRAEGQVSLQELFARRVASPLDLDALVKVDVVLPAVLGLVAVWESGIELHGLDIVLGDWRDAAEQSFCTVRHSVFLCKWRRRGEKEKSKSGRSG